MPNKTDIESVLSYVSESDSVTKFIEDLITENGKLREIDSEPKLHIHQLNLDILELTNENEYRAEVINTRDGTIKQLQKRLEISDTGYDGIECRDRTIKGLELLNKELKIDLSKYK